VIEVPVEGGERVKSGDVLLRIDPRPFEQRIKQLEAELSEARANRDLAQSAYERKLAARRDATVSRRDVDESRTRYEATMGSAGILEAQLEQAEMDLEEATVYAPADGRIARVTAQSGQIIGERDGPPLMSFLVQEEPALVATYPPNVMRHIRIGDRAQIALDRHPGRILEARVSAVLPASDDTPLDIGFEIEEQFSRYQVDGGAGGAAAIYTQKGQGMRVVRMVTIRMYTWLNYIL
jgi:RND family efflux transporter MFP subunit